MKISVLTALLAQASAVKMNNTATNKHLTATYILKDAAREVETLVQKVRAAEKATNTDYIKELDRKIAHINKERKHVLDGEIEADTLVAGNNLSQADKDRIAAEVKFAQEELEREKENIKK